VPPARLEGSSHLRAQRASDCRGDGQFSQPGSGNSPPGSTYVHDSDSPITVLTQLP
jgi:hypothetical protein